MISNAFATGSVGISCPLMPTEALVLLRLFALSACNAILNQLNVFELLDGHLVDELL